MISETVPCGYMQPTKASIAAQNQELARKRKGSRNNEFASPLKRPGTAVQTQSSVAAAQYATSTTTSTQQSSSMRATPNAGRAEAKRSYHGRRDSNIADGNKESSASANVATVKP